MQIPADLSDNDHCLVCRRTWQEAIGDHWQDELDRNVVQTNPKIELCLHCYKQCDQFLENRFFEGNSSKLPEHIGVIKQLSIYAYQWCRFCGAFNGPQTRLFSSENGVSICLDCYVELVHIHISLEAANPRFSHEIYQTHYQSKLKKIASFQASRPPLLTDEQRASQLKDRKTEITASHAFLLGQTIKKEHSNVGRIFHPGGITHQLQQATPEQPPVQPTTKTEEILGKRALVKEDTDEPPLTVHACTSSTGHRPT